MVHWAINQLTTIIFSISLTNWVILQYRIFVITKNTDKGYYRTHAITCEHGPVAVPNAKNCACNSVYCLINSDSFFG